MDQIESDSGGSDIYGSTSAGLRRPLRAPMGVTPRPPPPSNKFLPSTFTKIAFPAAAEIINNNSMTSSADSFKMFRRPTNASAAEDELVKSRQTEDTAMDCIVEDARLLALSDDMSVNGSSDRGGGRSSSSRGSLCKVSFREYMTRWTHGRKGDEELRLHAKLDFKIEKLGRPIGLAVLPNGVIVIGNSCDHEVKMYSPKGKLLSSLLSSARPFKRPSDMVALPDGRFGVRDDLGIQLFDDDGQFLKTIGDGVLGKCFGLATSGKGQIFTINTNYHGVKNNPTIKGETDVLSFDVETGDLVTRFQLIDIITARERSKCRFLHFKKRKLYIVDLGLDCVYVLNVKSMNTRAFGNSGKNSGEFLDPAGICVDSVGNIIVADSRNHRLEVFDKSRKYIGQVAVDRALRRPSGLVFDADSGNCPAIYVLNLWENSMAKYFLVKQDASKLDAS